MNVLLIVALVYVGINVLIGYKKGLLHIVLTLLSWIIISVVAVLITPTFSDYLCENTQIDEYIQENYTDNMMEKVLNAAKDHVMSQVNDQIGEGADTSSISGDSSSIFEGGQTDNSGIGGPDVSGKELEDSLNKVFNGDVDVSGTGSSGVDEDELAGMAIDDKSSSLFSAFLGLGNQTSDTSEKSSDSNDVIIPDSVADDLDITGDVVDMADGSVSTEEGYSALSDKMTSMAMKGLSLLIIIVGLGIVYLIILSSLKGVDEVPVLGKANKIAGSVIGLIKSVCLIWVFMAVVAMNATATFAQSVTPYVESSVVLSALYGHNPILYILLKVL